MAYKPGERTRLIEVKVCSRKALWQNFRRVDREAHISYAKQHRMCAEVALIEPGTRGFQVIDQTLWP